MKFRDLDFEVKNLLDMEGPAMKLVESVDESGDRANEQLYIAAMGNNYTYVYAKVNETALMMYCQGRITTKELFMLREDDLFYVQKGDDITEHNCNEQFVKKVLSNIVYADFNYYAILERHRLLNPIKDVMHTIRNCYFNGFVSVDSEIHNKQNLNTELL
jgi:hypothetical protein